MTSPVVEAVFRDLLHPFQEHQEPARAEAVRRYFKEPVQTYGLSAPHVRTLAKASLLRLKREARLGEIFDLCERLLQTGRLEEGTVVETLIRPFLKSLTPEHFPVLDRWVDYCSNCAVTDSISSHVVGALLERHGELIPKLVPWTASESRWRRRASCVSLVVPVRRGMVALQAVFAITDNLMDDRDDMVQKGAGWLLRDLSVLQQDAVVEYLRRYPSVGRILVRYTLEKTPSEQRQIFIKRPLRSA